MLVAVNKAPDFVYFYSTGR